MRSAHFSKSAVDRVRFAERFIAESGKQIVIYLYPQNRGKTLIKPEVGNRHVIYASYEEMTKTNKWLQINQLISEDSVLILDNPSRYARMSASKALSVGRLGKSGAKAIVDIAPFVFGIHHLFHSMSFLGKDVLGFASYHAWREGYQELDRSGQVKSSHDPAMVSDKLKGFCSIAYSAFKQSDRTIVEFESTKSEHEKYEALKSELFANPDFEPQPAITRLADLAHAFDTRINALIELLSSLNGSTLLYTNLKSYASKALTATKRAGLKEVFATSYQIGSNEKFDNIVYLESPIVNRHFFLEAEANIRDGGKVYHFLGDTKVDKLLFRETATRLDEVHNFTKELYYAIHGDGGRVQTPEAIPAKKCVASCPGAGQLALF